MDALRDDRRYTYADYAKWDGDTRYELIDGVAYMMSPAPGRKHQRISGELFWQIKTFLKWKPCGNWANAFRFSFGHIMKRSTKGISSGIAFSISDDQFIIC